MSKLLLFKFKGQDQNALTLILPKRFAKSIKSPAINLTTGLIFPKT
jgi:hypothetical protein